jgi:hypothetical protein
MRLRMLFAAVAVVTVGLAGLARAEVAQENGVQVVFGGELSPKELPRSGSAPVKVSVSASIAPVGARTVPQLRRISIAINRHGRIDSTGLPVCRTFDIQPSTSAKALQACRRSLVGEGRLEARLLLPEQAPLPSRGKILAFTGAYQGRPAILAHVYGTEPVPTSYTMPFLIKRTEGVFGTTLVATLPQVTSDWGYITGLELTLQRRYRWGGRTRSFAVAGCPAPKGFPSAVFPFAKANLGFEGRDLELVAIRTCRARG